LLLALVLGLLLIALQWPLKTIAFSLLNGSDEVETIARQYFDIRIWGAPATLGTFCLMGVLVGLGMSRLLLLMQLLLNASNAGLDVYFAGVLDMGARGIALGTVVAEWGTLLIAGAVILYQLNRRKIPSEYFWSRSRIFNRERLLRTLSANRDIMLRTLLLVFSFAFFTNQSARFGDIILAANHILMQLISFSAFFLDGYAFVAEAAVGTSIGAGRRDRFDLAVKRTTVLAAASALGLALAIWLLGGIAIAALTDLDNVRRAANEMLYLAAAYVLISFPAFQLDGIFIGASFTREMRNAAFISVAVFLLAWGLLIERMGVTGLWFAMIVYVAARADALLLYFPRLRRTVPAAAG
ncbi:MAG: MATE family efflux transporter, partial [Gammaproteobacteria bacterium]